VGERRALVIGSQCADLPNQPLSFLPELAKSLFKVLTDPEIGGCVEIRSRLVLDPKLAEMVAAVKDTVADADTDAATLVVAFIGHAEAARNGRLYLLPHNGTSPPTMDTGFLLGERFSELIGRHSNVDGLILLVDACESGVGVADLAQRAGMEIAEAGARVQLLTATYDQAARDGCFTRNLHALLRDGLADLSSDYLLADAVAARIAAACPGQEEPRLAAFQGRWTVSDPGLWLGRNVRSPNRWVLAGTVAGAQAVELTEHFAVTGSLDRVLAAWQTAPLVALVGEAGTGKSALAAALTRPELAPGIVFPGLVDALAFASVTPSAAAIAETLSDQLRRVNGFPDAVENYRAQFDQETLKQQEALTQLVVGPLRALGAASTRRLRLAIDGLDQLDASAREGVLAAAHVLANDPQLDGVRVLLTGRPEAFPPPDAMPRSEVRLGALSSEELNDYLRHRAVPERLWPLIAPNVRTWLDARLFADLIAASSRASGPHEPEAYAGLDDLYEQAIAVAKTGLGDHVVMAAVLSVLAAAGVGPVLPVQLLADAVGELNAPISVKQTRDALVLLGGLVVRARAGTADEHVGLFHETLVDHLRNAVVVPGGGPGDGHRALISAIEADTASDHPAYSRYAKTHLPEHLWAVGRHAYALSAVIDALGDRAADNARVLSPWVEKAIATLGPDNPDTLRARGELARFTGEAGDSRGAVQQLTALAPDMERVLGPHHTDSLAIRRRLARFSGDAGDAQGAVHLLTALLPDVEHVFGPDHRDTLATRNSLALWTGWAGDPAGAMQQLAVLLPDVERILGPDHRDTLATRLNLAGWTGATRDPAGAVQQLTALLPDVQRVLGPDHRDTLTTRNNLAHFTGEAGEPQVAARQLTALLPDVERVLGPDHPDTLAIRRNLAGWRGSAGDAADAVVQLTALLPDVERVLGLDHPDTLATRNNLARFTGEAGDPQRAVQQLTTLLTDVKRALGPADSQALATRRNLARFTGEAGDPDKAVQQLTALLTDAEQALGPVHRETMKTRDDLAHWEAVAGEQLQDQGGK
jgi:hypothetical protein